jgi:hypothetical protein
VAAHQFATGRRDLVALTACFPDLLSGLAESVAREEDYEKAVLAGISCGGDTDSVAAIIGGIVGAGVGTEGIPTAWRTGIADFPCTLAYLTRLGEALAEGKPLPRLFFPVLLLRNLFLLFVVLYHGFRRMVT